MLKKILLKQSKIKSILLLFSIALSIILLTNKSRVYADDIEPDPLCIGPALNDYVNEVISSAGGCTSAGDLNGIGIFTNGNSAGLSYIQITQPGMVVLYDDFAKASAIKSASSNTMVVGRSSSFSDNIPLNLNMDDYKNTLRDLINSNSEVDVWQGYNEAVYHLREQGVSKQDAYDWQKRHDIATIEVGNETGKAVCVGAFKEGWPRDTDFGTGYFNDYVSSVMNAASSASVPVYLCVHEHESATSNSGNWTFGTRYNGWFVRTKNAGLNLPVLVTVAGYDSEAGPDIDAGSGWKTSGMPASTYASMLKSYAQSAQSNGAQGIAVFQVGLSGWEQYDIIELLTANSDPNCTGEPLQHIKLLSPAFNMTNNIGAQIAANMDPDIFSKLDGIAGNAYITADNSIIWWVANFLNVSGLGYSKPVMITETGDVSNGIQNPNQDLLELGNQLEYVKNGSFDTGNGFIRFLGGLLFNPFPGTNPGWSQFNLSDSDISTGVCRGNCDGIGANTASFYAHDDVYTHASSLDMSYVLEISNIDESTTDGVLAAVNAGVKPIIRVGTGSAAGPVAFAYGSYLKHLDSLLPAGSTVYAIAGPNEPQTECWAAPQCGCDISAEIPKIKISGRVLSPKGKPVNGVTVQEYKGTLHTSLEPVYDYGDFPTRGNVNGTDEKGNIVRGEFVWTDARNYLEGVAVSGRLTTDTNRRLVNESDGCYPQGKGENCAGYFNFDTYQIANSNRSHIGFFCGGSTIPQALLLVSLTGDINLGNITVDCPETGPAYEAPMKIKASSSNYLTCHQGEDYPVPNNVVTSRESPTYAKLAKKDLDNSYYGNPYDPDPGEIGLPSTGVVHAGSGKQDNHFNATLSTVNPPVEASNVMSLAINTFPVTGGETRTPQVPLHDTEIQLPDCNEFKYSNSILGNQEEYPGINSKSSVGYGFNLAFPGFAQCIFEHNIASGMIDPNRNVCVLNGEKKTLQDLANMGQEWIPLWSLYGGDNKAAISQIQTYGENSSLQSDPRTTPQTATETGENPFKSDNIYQTVTTDEGINPLSFSRFLSVMNMYNPDSTDICTNPGGLINAIAYPSIVGKDPLSLDVIKLAGIDPSIKVEDVGLQFDYCTYNVIASDPSEENNNRTTIYRNDSPLAPYATFKDLTNNAPVTTVNGKALSGGNIFQGVLAFLKSLFGVTEQNAVVGGLCVPQLDWCSWTNNPDCTLECYLFNASGEKLNCPNEDRVTVCGDQNNYPYLSPDLLAQGYVSAQCNFAGGGTIGGYNTGNQSQECVGDTAANLKTANNSITATQPVANLGFIANQSTRYPIKEEAPVRTLAVNKLGNLTPSAELGINTTSGTPVTTSATDTASYLLFTAARYPDPVQASYLGYGGESGGPWGTYECDIPPDNNLCSVAHMLEYFSTEEAATKAAIVCYAESGGDPLSLNNACTYSDDGLDNDNDGLIDSADPDYDHATLDYSVGLFQNNLVIPGRCPGGDGISSYSDNPPQCVISNQSNLDACAEYYSQSDTDPAIIDGGNAIQWAVTKSGDGSNWSAWTTATLCGIN